MDDPSPAAAVRAAQQEKAEAIGVPAARRHIFLCCDQAKPKCCDRDRSIVAWDYLKARLVALGLADHGGIARTKANCLRICIGGPIAVVYPEGTWYGGITRERFDRILQEHLIGGVPVAEWVVARNSLSAPPKP